MTYEQGGMVGKILRQLLYNVDRPVLSSGAPDGDGEVVAGVLHVQGQPAAYKATNVVDHGLDAAKLAQPLGNGLVAPGQRPQDAFVMGVGQAAYVEYQVGIARSEGHTTELQSLMRNSYAVFRV